MPNCFICGKKATQNAMLYVERGFIVFSKTVKIETWPVCDECNLEKTEGRLDWIFGKFAGWKKNHIGIKYHWYIYA